MRVFCAADLRRKEEQECIPCTHTRLASNSGVSAAHSLLGEGRALKRSEVERRLCSPLQPEQKARRSEGRCGRDAQPTHPA